MQRQKRSSTSTAHWNRSSSTSKDASPRFRISSGIRCAGWWLIRATFGLASLVLLLAILAAVPIVNFVTLGYLLEAEGRVGRTGRFRQAFPLIGTRAADRIDRARSLAVDDSVAAAGIRRRRCAADRPSIAGHVCPDCAQVCRVVGHHRASCAGAGAGGSLGCFFRPLKNVLWLFRQLRSGSYFATASREIRTFVSGLRLRHHFSLGLRALQERSSGCCCRPPAMRR